MESPSEEQRSEGDSERSVSERRRLHALYRAYGNEGAGCLQDCPRPNSAAVFCYSSAWVLQGIEFSVGSSIEGMEAPSLFARSLHALYLAAHRKFNTLRYRAHERIDIKTNCRAPQPGRGGPVPPSRPAFVARLALAARLSVL